jgi:calcineurin-like phosphoesterase family protein
VPATVVQGATTRIDGSGFVAGSSGQLTWDGSATGMPGYTASASGSFSVVISVPSTAATGGHTVAARGIAGGKRPRNLASTSVTVTGPTPTPTQVATPTPTSNATSTPGNTPPPTPAPVTALVAGDVASCSSSGDEATAALLGANAGTIIIPGDIAYENGSTSDFNNCFNPSWGPYKGRMKPAPGNHEYNTAGATGYYGYFGPAAGDPTKGYYAYDLGGWRMYALNSNCAAIGGCAAGSAQEQWLRADLAANPRQCVGAYWHHPRFSSGEHGSSTLTQALYQALYDFNADLILVGHDHDYERFAAQNAAGVADAARGIRQFVVGTGGRSHYATVAIANSEVRNSDTYGLLKLTLSATGYSWQFLPEAGKTFTDSGSTSCH